MTFEAEAREASKGTHVYKSFVLIKAIGRDDSKIKS